MDNIEKETSYNKIKPTLISKALEEAKNIIANNFSYEYREKALKIINRREFFGKMLENLNKLHPNPEDLIPESMARTIFNMVEEEITNAEKREFKGSFTPKEKPWTKHTI